MSAVMKDAGRAHMGVGRAAGKDKAEAAAKMAISSPLLETSINGARGVLINVTGSMDIGLEEVETAANLVQEAAHPDANIIFGAAFDDSLEDELRVTVIATGFDEKDEPAAMGAKPFSAAGAKKGTRPPPPPPSTRPLPPRLPSRRRPPSATTTGTSWSASSAASAETAPTSSITAPERRFSRAPGLFSSGGRECGAGLSVHDRGSGGPE
ncbi:MAG: hypothetical protein ACLT5P_14090 [Flavonifractor plautii]